MDIAEQYDADGFPNRTFEEIELEKVKKKKDMSQRILRKDPAKLAMEKIIKDGKDDTHKTENQKSAEAFYPGSERRRGGRGMSSVRATVG